MLHGLCKKIALFGEIGVIKSAIDLIGADMSGVPDSVCWMFWFLVAFVAIEAAAKIFGW